MAVTQTKPIELHYWTTPNGFKASIMLEELGVPYNLNMVNINGGDQFKPEFLAISPNNRIPAIVDPEGPGGEPISVFESGAILMYLGRKFGQFYPQEERARVEVEEWLMWQMGGFGPMLGQNHHFRMKAADNTYGVERYQTETARLYGVLNKRLEGRNFVAADTYSIADIAIVGWASRFERHCIDFNDYPNVGAWYQRLLGRPAVAKGLKLGEAERDRILAAAEKK